MKKLRLLAVAALAITASVGSYAACPKGNSWCVGANGYEVYVDTAGDLAVPGILSAGTLSCTTASYTGIKATGNVIAGSGSAYASTMTATTGNFATPGSVTAGSGSFASALAVTAGPLQPYQRTKAQLYLITPAVGDVYVCSDCTNTYTVVVATGTGADQFREVGTTQGVH